MRARPAGIRASKAIASGWTSVPSAIVPDEFNVLLNPRHADAAKVTATTVRPWTYDATCSWNVGPVKFLEFACR